MHSDICKLIGIKLGIMIDSTELYILVLSEETVTFTEGHRDTRKQTLLHQLSHKI